MSDGMGREFTYLSSHATNRYFIPNWGKVLLSEVECRFRYGRSLIIQLKFRKAFYFFVSTYSLAVSPSGSLPSESVMITLLLSLTL